MENTLYDVLYLGPNDNSGGHPAYVKESIPLQEALSYIKKESSNAPYFLNRYYLQITGTGYLTKYWQGVNIFRELDPENPWFKHKAQIAYIKEEVNLANRLKTGIPLGVKQVEALAFLLAELDKK